MFTNKVCYGNIWDYQHKKANHRHQTEQQKQFLDQRKCDHYLEYPRQSVDHQTSHK